MKRNAAILLLSFYSELIDAADCFDLAGRDYKIDSDLLRAIAWNESRYEVIVIGRNKDASIDVGVMQINSQHFGKLSAVGITQQHLRNDACMNIYTGAYFLANAFKTWGVNWQAVGAYNAGFRKSEKQSLRRFNYARKIESTYRIIKSSRSLLSKSDTNEKKSQQ